MNNKLSKPLVSIIMPVQNGEKYISKAMDSFLKQTYHNTELIIIDDASTDNTSKIINKYTEKNANIRYFYNKEKLGIPKSRNIALAKSNGDYIGHLDADDWLIQKSISTAMEVITKNERIALVYSGYIIHDENSSVTRKYLAKKFNKENLNELGWQHFGLYLKKAAISVSGFNEELITCSDGDFFTKIGEKFQCERIAKYLYNYRWHKNNVGYKRPHCIDCQKQEICAYFKVWEK